MLSEGTQAPEFTLPDKNNELYSLRSAQTEYTIIFFYPKDNTPGCTIETKGFNDLFDEFTKAKATVIGISGGNAESKTKFCEKVGKNVKLLSDENFKVCESYGVYGEKQFMGKNFMGIKRITYILDKDKKIIKAYTTVKPAVHPKEVLDFITP